MIVSLTASSVLIIVWIIALIVLSGLRAEMKTVSEEVAVEQKKNQNASSMPKLEDAVLGTYFVGEDEKVVLIEQLEALATQSGVGYELGNATDKDALTLDIGLTGSFSSIYYYLELLEHLPHKAVVERLELANGVKDSDTSSKWQAQVVVSFLTTPNKP